MPVTTAAAAGLSAVAARCKGGDSGVTGVAAAVAATTVEVMVLP